MTVIGGVEFHRHAVHFEDAPRPAKLHWLEDGRRRECSVSFMTSFKPDGEVSWWGEKNKIAPEPWMVDAHYDALMAEIVAKKDSLLTGPIIHFHMVTRAHKPLVFDFSVLPARAEEVL